MASNKSRRLEQDELVRELVPNATEVPDAKMFVGLLGASAQEGYWRLYFSTDLKDYLEVRDEDILLSKSLRTEENPLGGTAVWIRSGADLQVKRRSTAETGGADFLTGRITARFLHGAGPGGFTLGGVFVGGIKSIPPVESCVPSLCQPGPPPPDPPGTTAVCTLATNCPR
jgi:hypothetical protein